MYNVAKLSVKEVALFSEGAVMKPITDKEQQVTYLKERLEIFLEVLDAIDPETTELEDIDRLIKMMDDLEEKMEQFQQRSDA